jgi:hypothetical protein
VFVTLYLGQNPKHSRLTITFTTLKTETKASSPLTLSPGPTHAVINQVSNQLIVVKLFIIFNVHFRLNWINGLITVYVVPSGPWIEFSSSINTLSMFCQFFVKITLNIKLITQHAGCVPVLSRHQDNNGSLRCRNNALIMLWTCSVDYNIAKYYLR